MSETKFTPGPWELVSKNWEGRIVNGSDGNWIADLTMYHDTSESNAHLIASAPDLYEALELILSDEDYRGSLDAILLAHSALAKARGES